jgi:hypothetical protein
MRAGRILVLKRVETQQETAGLLLGPHQAQRLRDHSRARGKAVVGPSEVLQLLAEFELMQQASQRRCT